MIQFIDLICENPAILEINLASDMIMIPKTPVLPQPSLNIKEQWRLQQLRKNSSVVFHSLLACPIHSCKVVKLAREPLYHEGMVFYLMKNNLHFLNHKTSPDLELKRRKSFFQIAINFYNLDI